MAPILGLFYFGQQYRLSTDESMPQSHRQCHRLAPLQRLHQRPDRNRQRNQPLQLHQPISKTKQSPRANPASRQRSKNKFLISTSFTGGAVPTDNIAQHADFLLLHGNGIADPNRIRKMVDQTRALKSYHNQPILFNEDDHFAFDKPDNNFLAALSKGAGWGYSTTA